MATWPVTLPTKPLLSGNARTLPNVVIRTPNATGPVKVRRRTTAGEMPETYQYLLDSAAKRETFETFFNSTLAGGALTWTMTHPDLGTTRTFRFTAPPTIVAVAKNKYLVTVAWEVLPE